MQWRMQGEQEGHVPDAGRGRDARKGALTPEVGGTNLLFDHILPKKCTEIKGIGPTGGMRPKYPIESANVLMFLPKEVQDDR